MIGCSFECYGSECAECRWVMLGANSSRRSIMSDFAFIMWAIIRHAV
jgi:hypothetical protein